ncbi:hypothetical protein DFAR_630030 [Desulfarculales bacterium]
MGSSWSGDLLGAFDWLNGLLRLLDLAVNCRVKRDHHLLRLESSSTTAPTGGSLFLQKPDLEGSNP